jgi:hypothetical protein
MPMRSDGKAGVDVWLCFGWATNMCCRARAGRAVVAMTCGGAIGSIVWVLLIVVLSPERLGGVRAAVATGLDHLT